MDSLDDKAVGARPLLWDDYVAAPLWQKTLRNTIEEAGRTGEDLQGPDWRNSINLTGVEDLPVFAFLAGNPSVRSFDRDTHFMTPIERRMAVGLTLSGRSLAFVAQYPIGDYKADFLVWHPAVTTRVVVECDGFDYHERTREQAAHDKKRDRRMMKAGYVVRRFSGSEIHNDIWGCVSEIREEFDWAIIESPAWAPV